MIEASLWMTVDDGIVLLVDWIVDKVGQGGMQWRAERCSGGQRVQECMR